MEPARQLRQGIEPCLRDLKIEHRTEQTHRQEHKPKEPTQAQCAVHQLRYQAPNTRQNRTDTSTKCNALTKETKHQTQNKTEVTQANVQWTNKGDPALEDKETKTNETTDTK